MSNLPGQSEMRIIRNEDEIDTDAAAAAGATAGAAAATSAAASAACIYYVVLGGRFAPP